jgi:hypothetical protein
MSNSDHTNDSKLILRSKLCVECDQRIADETHAPPAPAGCESECMLFANLPRLERVVNAGEPPSGYEVFAKSLQPFLDDLHRLNLVHALTILDAAKAKGSERSLDHPDAAICESQL